MPDDVEPDQQAERSDGCAGCLGRVSELAERRLTRPALNRLLEGGGSEVHHRVGVLVCNSEQRENGQVEGKEGERRRVTERSVPYRGRCSSRGDRMVAHEPPAALGAAAHSSDPPERRQEIASRIPAGRSLERRPALALAAALRPEVGLGLAQETLSQAVIRHSTAVGDRSTRRHEPEAPPQVDVPNVN